MASTSKNKDTTEAWDPARCLKHSHTVIAFVLIAAAATLAYSNTFKVPFIFDDGQAIPDNRNIRHVFPLHTADGRGSMDGPAMTTIAARPFVSLTLAINYAISGVREWSYHAGNLIIHILAALCLFGIVRRTLLRPKLRDEFGRAATGLALVSGLIFAVHPLQTESVTYTIQRCESLMGLCFLATLYFAIVGWDLPRWRIPFHVLAALCCAAGMASKEVMVVAPLIVLLYDYLFNSPIPQAKENDKRTGGVDAPKQPNIVLSSIVLYIGLIVAWGVLLDIMSSGKSQAASNIDVGLLRTPPIVYLMSQGKIILYYLRLAFWPNPLCIDYSWPAATTFWEVLPYVEVLGVMLYLSVRACIKGQAWGFLGAWFFLILAPTSSILPITDLAFEHRMYLPLAGVIVLVVTAMYGALGRFSFDPAMRRWGGLALASLAVAALGVRTYARNNDYRTDLAIWEAALKYLPNNSRVHNNFGNALYHLSDDDKALEEYNGRYHLNNRDEALKEFRIATQLDPLNISAFNNLGNLLNGVGKYDEALWYFERAVRLKSDFPIVYSNRGVALGFLNRHEEAVEAFKQCIKLSPEFVDVHINIAVSLEALKDYDGAMEHLKTALQLATDNPIQRSKAFHNLAHVLSNLGKHEEAVENYKKAVETAPRFALAEYNLGLEYEEIKQPEEALKHYKAAALIKNPIPPIIDAQSWMKVGELVALLDRPEEALEAYRASIKADPKLYYSAIKASDILEKQNRLDEALAMWDGMLKDSPDDYMCHLKYGIVLNHLGKAKEAIPHLKKAVAKIETPEAHTALANAYEVVGDNESALSELREVLRLLPESTIALVNVAHALTKLGRTDEAIQQFQAALKSDPNLASAKRELNHAFLQRGTDMELAGKLNDAVANWKSGIETFPDDPAFRHHIGRLLLALGKPAESIPHFEAEIRTTTENAAGANMDVGVALAQLGKDADAMAHFEEAMRLAPDNVEMKINIARAMENMLANEAALKIYKDIVHRKPDTAMAYNNMAKVLSVLKRDEEAAESLREALRLQTDYPDAEGNLGIVLARLNKTDDAIEHYKKALKLNSKDLNIRDNYARLLARLGRTAEAIAEYKEILKLDPKNIRAFIGMGNCLADDGKKDDAIANYHNALKINPNDGDAHNCLGAVLAQLKKYQEAADHFTLALKANPGDPAAIENLKRVKAHLQKSPEP